MEAVLTVAIVLLLTALAIPAYLKTQPQRQKDQCLRQLDDIASACRRYAIEQGGFPASIAALAPAYLPEIPACPLDGSYALGTPEGTPPSCTIHAPTAADLVTDDDLAAP